MKGKLKIKYGNLLFNALMSVLFALAFNLPIVATLAVSFAIGVALGFAKKNNFALFMAVQVEIWEKDIVEGLWADNAFLNFATNADQYVLAGKVVHIPQAGAAPSVTKNRTSFPAVAAQRGDTDVTYSLDTYTSDPVHITNAEEIEDSYDKRASVMAETRSAISDKAALNMISNWAPATAASIARTTGSAVAAHLPGATGNRLAFSTADVKAAMTKFNTMSIPQADRYMLVDAVMYDQFINSLTDTQYRDFSRVINEATGVVGKLYGFNIMVRGTVGAYNNATTPGNIVPGTAGSATDNGVSLCWQKNSVERALGAVKFYENIGNPLYYGDIYSSELRLGGRIRRADEKGVLAIVQAASA